MTGIKIVLAALVLTLAAAACGGNNNSPSVASAGGSTTTTSSSSSGGGTASSGGTAAPRGGSLTMVGGKASDMRKFASCMRSHGVPNFPDPNANGAITVTGLNPDSPSFRNAQNACKKYTPRGGQPPSPAQQAKMQAAALKFSACMRAHGLPNFPDPTFSNGGASLRISKAQLDPSSPTFQRAQQACAKNLPGKVQTAKGAQ
jgi:hypothetical protein